MATRDVPLPSATVRAREAGRGPTLVLLACDPPNVVEHYDALFAACPLGVRMVAFEMPGFGRSRLSRGTTYSLDDQVRVVRELLGVLGTERVVLAFPCVAAYVALALAARHPAMVQGLVLMQAPSWQDEMRWLARVDRNGLLRRRVVGQLVMRLRGRDVARRWYAAAAKDAPSMERVAMRAFDEGARFPLADAFQALSRERADLRGATQPTLLVWGAGDRSHKRSDPRGLRALVPHAQSVVFDEAAHFPELEAPERFAQALSQFVAKLPA